MVTTMKCPSCGMEMQPHPDSELRLDCPSCGMAFLSRRHLENLAEGLSDRIEYDPSPELCAQGICRVCPICHVPMKKATLLHHNGWLLDYCPQCEGFFLERNEEAEMTGRLPDRLTGEYHIQGYNLRSERMLVTTSLDSSSYLRLTVMFHTPLGLGVRIYSEKWTDSLSLIFGRLIRTALITGNRLFDDRFSIRGRDGERIRQQLLTPALQKDMLDFLASYRFFDNPPTLELLDDRLLIVEGPVPFDRLYDLKNDPNGIITAAISLAKAIEANLQHPLKQPEESQE